MQLTYLPSGVQDTGRQTSGVLLLQAALGQIAPPRTAWHFSSPGRIKTMVMVFTVFGHSIP